MVHRVRDPRLGREVAMKMMLGGAWSGDVEQKRFLREARLMADLSHPGIVPVHDMGIVDGVPYYTMDLVEGKPLDRFVREKGLALPALVRLFAEVCEAVHYAHMKGVIHRDLKPGNILVTAAGRPVILDFGIACLTRADPAGGFLTVSGVIMGTPSYMAPEQAQGRVKEIDTRSDTYALGVILYELVTGRVPFSGGETYALLKEIIEKDPPRPSAYAPRIPADLESVILKAIAKEKDRRYFTAHALAEDLRRLLAGRPVEAHPDTRGYRLRKWARRHRELTASVGAALVIIVAFAGWAFLRLYEENRRSVDEARRADAEARNARAERQKAVDALDRLRTELEVREKRARAESLFGAAERVVDPDTRLEMYDETLALDPGMLIVRMKKAFLLVERGRLEDAVAEYGRILEIDPRYPDACAGIARTLRMQKKPDRALEACDRAIAIDPDFAPAHQIRGAVLIDLGRFPEALASLRRAIEITPDYPNAHLGIGVCLIRTGDREGGLAAFDRCLAAEPANVDARYRRGQVLVSLKRDAEALDDFDVALRVNPHHPEALLARARSLVTLSRLQEALAACEQRLEVRPASAEAFLLKGNILRDLRRWEASVAAYSEALALDPALPGARINLSDVLMRLDRHQESLEAAERGLALHPESLELMLNRAAALTNLGRFDEALAAIAAATGAAPELGDPVFLRAICLERTGKGDEAIREYENALRRKFLSQRIEKACAGRLAALRKHLGKE